MPAPVGSTSAPEPSAQRRWLAVLALLGPLIGLGFGMWLRSGMSRPVPREFDALLLVLALTAGVGALFGLWLSRALDPRAGDPSPGADGCAGGSGRASAEVEDLNDSVIEIMQAVGTIATSKDLTLRVPITENVTGAIADALNLLTEETRRVLLNVRSVSRLVAETTLAVKGQSDSAGKAAAREQREVAMAAQELAAAAAALEAIAARSLAGNEAAERAVQATEQAMAAVAETATGVGRTRELIRETEKRIKRLGERSQEIGQVVGIIQGIAERTGILALNASMHAAAAGEAGRSFAVVADEVRRLSESARESTLQIGRLVNAIRTETHDTVIAMNHAIAQVVEISRLAEASGREMGRSQAQTVALAADVRDIARTAEEQARAGATLQDRARIIQEASAETARQLSLQAAETRRLVDSARALLDEVGVFRLGDG